MFFWGWALHVIKYSFILTWLQWRNEIKQGSLEWKAFLFSALLIILLQSLGLELSKGQKGLQPVCETITRLQQNICSDGLRVEQFRRSSARGRQRTPNGAAARTCGIYEGSFGSSLRPKLRRHLGNGARAWPSVHRAWITNQCPPAPRRPARACETSVPGAMSLAPAQVTGHRSLVRAAAAHWCLLRLTLTGTSKLS